MAEVHYLAMIENIIWFSFDRLNNRVKVWIGGFNSFDVAFFQRAKVFNGIEKLIDVGHTLDKIFVFSENVNFRKIELLLIGFPTDQWNHRVLTVKLAFWKPALDGSSLPAETCSSRRFRSFVTVRTTSQSLKTAKLEFTDPYSAPEGQFEFSAFFLTWATQIEKFSYIM